MTVYQLYLEHSIGKSLKNCAFNFNYILFGHLFTSLFATSETSLHISIYLVDSLQAVDILE